MKNAHSELQTPYQILFLHAYNNVTELSIILNGLQANQQVEFSQYPPFPPAYRSCIPDDIWHELQLNVIESNEELLRKLSQKAFDLVIIYDKRGEMVFPGQRGIVQVLRRWWKFVRKLNSAQKKKKVLKQPRLPISFAELCQKLPVAAVDLRDALYLEPGDVEILKHSHMYFKREVPYNRFTLYHHFRKKSSRNEETIALFNKVREIPLGILDRRFEEFQQKRQKVQDIDIFYGSSTSNTMRITALKRLEKLSKATTLNIVIAREVLPFEEYCQLIARSKITISVEGDGWDCFRHYEAVALGSLPLINRPTMDATWWYDMPEDIFFENNFSNFESKIQQMLDMDGVRKKALQKMDDEIREHMLWSKIIGYIAETSLKPLQEE